MQIAIAELRSLKSNTVSKRLMEAVWSHNYLTSLARKDRSLALPNQIMCQALIDMPIISAASRL